MVNNVYVLGKGLISATGHSMDPNFWTSPRIPATYPWKALEPSYEGMIQPNQLRRLSKAVRMGIGAARMALEEAGLQTPDMISTGTALGCFQDTEVFMDQMVRYGEEKLSPTAFIQSTHNTVGGQIALATGCLGQNLCFVQRGHSFEHAFLDASLWLESHPGGKALVGGVEEITPMLMEIFRQNGAYRTQGGDPRHLMETQGGSLAGEGAGFFVVSDSPGNQRPVLKVEGLEIFSAANGHLAIEKWGSLRKGRYEELPDMLLSGQDGHPLALPFYAHLSQSLEGTPCYPFKLLTGSFETVSALALGLACHMARGKWGFWGSIPGPGDPPPRRIWILHHHMQHYSFWNLRLFPD